MKITGCFFPRGPARRKQPPASFWPLAVTLFSFVIGVAAGTIIGGGAQSESVLLDDGSIYAAGSFLELLFSCSKYHLLIILFATSFLGTALIPFTCALRGFVLSCTAASILAAFPGDAAALVLIVLGLPSLLTVPCLFILACGGLRLSSDALSFFTGGAVRANGAFFGVLQSLLLCALALLAAAGIEYVIVPPLVRLII